MTQRSNMAAMRFSIIPALVVATFSHFASATDVVRGADPERVALDGMSDLNFVIQIKDPGSLTRAETGRLSQVRAAFMIRDLQMFPDDVAASLTKKWKELHTRKVLPEGQTDSGPEGNAQAAARNFLAKYGAWKAGLTEANVIIDNTSVITLSDQQHFELGALAATPEDDAVARRADLLAISGNISPRLKLDARPSLRNFPTADWKIFRFGYTVSTPSGDIPLTIHRHYIDLYYSKEGKLYNVATSGEITWLEALPQDFEAKFKPEAAVEKVFMALQASFLTREDFKVRREFLFRTYPSQRWISVYRVAAPLPSGGAPEYLYFDATTNERVE